MYVLRYLRQIAVITPYAQISFDFKALDSKHDLSMMFRRRTASMPEPPLHVRPPVSHAWCNTQGKHAH